MRTSLVGDALDDPWISWLAGIEPTDESSDVSSLLMLRELVISGWIDENAAAPLIQLPVEEACGAIRKLARAEVLDQPLLQTVRGTPDGSVPAWILTQAAKDDLASRDQHAGHARDLPTRTEIATSYAKARGRISSTELGSLVGASGTNVGGTLKALAADGVLEPSNSSGRRRGFYYRWAQDAEGP